MGKLTVHHALQNAVQKNPNKSFLFFNEQSISFKELDEISNRLASSLLDEGFKKGDNIAVVALNQLEWLYTYFAAAKIGVGVVALNVRYREAEFEYMLNNSNCKGLVTINEFADFNYSQFFRGFQSKVPTIEKYIFIGGGFEGSLSFEELVHRAPNIEKLAAAQGIVQEEDTVIIIYTSGTTGRPKGTKITNKSILASARAQADHTKLTEADRIVGNLPLNHVGGITCTIHTALVSMGSVVLVPFFTADLVLEAIHYHKPTMIGGVPTMFVMMLNHKDVDKYDLSSIRICTIGGSNVEPRLCNILSEKFPEATLFNLYGLSESSGACVLTKTTDPMEKVQQSIGVPIGDFKVKVVDVNKEELPVGDVGELAFKGECIANGYFGLEKESMETFSDEWLYTGDMGSVDEEGYIYFKGRQKEVYIQGGYNVYPVEVENILATHPKVAIVAGIGVPDSFFGEVGRFYIITIPGASVTEEELKLFCRQHIADYKVPKQFEIVTELPLTPAGKVQKALLKQQYLQESEGV
ncbi:class I adenylate-forming enzyme family protein [Alkalihalobacterium alkalinitrilicum]|uniref:class I adenylate-forming enzyme family protein n=1 Tax=Alkalihalobacterium alkalinitrilicum TaxID=427920 RepID=UPI0009952B29|nr:AMP-binding protein [Alkalihalobacterium alkalinitrilicum]